MRPYTNIPPLMASGNAPVRRTALLENLARIVKSLNEQSPI